MNKIGRNDPCPCGSGKKNKKCCLNKRSVNEDDLPGLIKKFEQYNPVELITKLAALQLLPENHVYSLRLEFISTIAASSTHTGGNSISTEKLVSEIEEHYPNFGEIGRMEDPPEELFTDNIIYHGGNYIVYPGITEHGRYILQSLLNAIYHTPNKLSNAFKKNIQAISIASLSISNEIASRLGHLRYMAYENGTPEHIAPLNPGKQQQYCAATTFTETEINHLLARWGLDHSILNPFVAEFGAHPIPKHYTQSGLFQQPIVKNNDQYIVALPASLIGALRHYIWVQSRRSEEIDELALCLNGYVSKSVKENFRLMSFNWMKADLPEWDYRDRIKEQLYSIDLDKWVYVQVIADSASDYDISDPYGHWDDEILFLSAQARQEDVSRWVFDNNSDITGLLCITVISGIGRSFGVPGEVPPPSTYKILIAAADLEVVTRLRDADSLSLWKYAVADHTLKTKSIFPVISFSFLDKYSLYLDRDQSFYVSDKHPIMNINVGVGYGRNLRIKSARLWDTHLAEFGNPPTLIGVARRYNAGEIPIYVLEDSIGRRLDHLVEGYLQSIWIQSAMANEKIPSNERSMHFQVTSMLAYWLWQLTPKVRDYLGSLGSDPIHIIYDLENSDRWVASNQDDAISIDGPYYRYRIDSRDTHFTICDALRPVFHRADNKAERIVLEGILLAINELIEMTTGSPSMLRQEVEQIIDLVAPTGRKKMMILFDPTRMSSIDPRFLPGGRTIQDYDIQLQLDGLVKAINYGGPVGEVVDIGERVSICNRVVERFLEKIKILISRYDDDYLLRGLISLNEALLHEKRKQKLTIPTSLECFGDVPSELEKIATTTKKYDSTSMGVRTLIEIVAAEPPQGEIKCSTSDLDALIAQSYLLLDWATTSDQLHLGIFNHGISILQSGRIGRKLDYIKEAWDPFYRAKTQEWMEDAIERFDDYFEKDDSDISNDRLNRFEVAFEAEFGATVTDIVEFCDILSRTAFELKTSSARMPLSDLIKHIGNNTNISRTKIDNLIQLFSLEPRESWDIAPIGFTEQLDIWPWRFNRRLSYVRRPLVIRQSEKGIEQVYWGPRAVEESGHYLANLVQTGRYRLEHCRSEEMKVLIGELANEQGHAFTLEVSEFFRENSSWEIDTEVSIGPDGDLTAIADIGDIDVLIIDNLGQRIYSIECKDTAFARNARELANEIEKFDADRKDSWMFKHLGRDQWIRQNIPTLSSKYSQDLSEYRISSVLISSELIPTSFISGWALPVISIHELRRNGIGIIEGLAS